jgi:hypothetical protein
MASTITIALPRTTIRSYLLIAGPGFNSRYDLIFHCGHLPGFYTVGTVDSFAGGIRRAGREADHSPSCTTAVKNWHYLQSSTRFMTCSLVTNRNNSTMVSGPKFRDPDHHYGHIVRRDCLMSSGGQFCCYRPCTGPIICRCSHFVMKNKVLIHSLLLPDACALFQSGLLILG